MAKSPPGESHSPSGSRSSREYSMTAFQPRRSGLGQPRGGRPEVFEISVADSRTGARHSRSFERFHDGSQPLQRTRGAHHRAIRPLFQKPRCELLHADSVAGFRGGNLRKPHPRRLRKLALVAIDDGCVAPGADGEQPGAVPQRRWLQPLDSTGRGRTVGVHASDNSVPDRQGFRQRFERQQKAAFQLAPAWGRVWKLATAIAAKVPNDPIMSFAISRPATFLTTMPPELTSLPSRVANCMPITRSRAVP